ncbi:phospho-acceptor domain-containing protein [Breznakibacter xylanolyticus]|uniref:histidine kinase n=1 Tax=Breznakibacter xylanolyticus TaxID=990 RepID=A0A2W7N376_9BACT|nr:response regulator [Breznakibacter xylanolyticus]MBN2743289.1 response regulator [Marinilabiliaceae bacterium]PZX14518.1 phospho-acceptor domain-containing protein [Breznakibacter xylanolyticus]
MKLMSRFISIFLFEQAEKLDLEDRNRILIANLMNTFYFLVVFLEGIYSLFVEETIYAVPLLCFSLFYLVNFIFLARFVQKAIYQELLAWVTMGTLMFFMTMGGISHLGIVWSFLYPLFVISIFGRRKGVLYSLLLFGGMLIAFLPLSELIPLVQVYSLEWRIVMGALYLAMTLVAYVVHFISGELLINKEKIMLDSRNQSRSQEEQISQLSHQIRTPLSNITGIIDMLEKTRLDDDQRDYINTIHASANNLVNVVNSLVNAPKSGVSQEPEEETSFNLYAIINNTLRLFQDGQKDKRFSLSLSADIPSNLLGSSIKVKQILLNIFNSIIKQNKEEVKQINIEVTQKEMLPGKVVLLFRISSNHQMPLTRDMAQRDSLYNQDVVMLNTARYVQVLELGITQRLIEGDGNTMSIYTQTGQTIVEFSITLKESHKSQSVLDIQEKAKSVEPLFKGNVEMKDASILLVEDNFSNQQIIILYIKNHVSRIDVAFNGKEALDKFGKAKYDLILMDVQMPIMDGFKATQKIREIERSSNTHTPIIAVTANAFPEDRERCFASGMDDYISKPFQPEDLIGKIKQHLS